MFAVFCVECAVCSVQKVCSAGPKLSRMHRNILLKFILTHTKIHKKSNFTQKAAKKIYKKKSQKVNLLQTSATQIYSLTKSRSKTVTY